MSFRSKGTETHNTNFGEEETTGTESTTQGSTTGSAESTTPRKKKTSRKKKKTRTRRRRSRAEKITKPKQPEAVIYEWELEVVNAIAKMRKTSLTDREIYRKLVKIYHPRNSKDGNSEKINVQASYLNGWEHDLPVNAERREANKEKLKKKKVVY